MKLLKVAQKFDESLRSYWVGHMQNQLSKLRQELVRWEVHPNLLNALKGLSTSGDPDGLWGKGTNRALGFYNALVNWAQGDTHFSQFFGDAQKVTKGELSGEFVMDNELAKENAEIILNFRKILAKTPKADD